MAEQPRNRNRDENPEITVWTEFRVPLCEELDNDRWTRQFRPLVQAPGHVKTAWARIQERPDIVLLVTLWRTTSALRDFEASPSAQLYFESLAARAIVSLGRYEVDSQYQNWFGPLTRSFVQLFWVYFPAPVPQAQRAQISQLRGIHPPAFGPGVPRSKLLQRRLPVQLWSNETEYLRGREVHLMLWPHFWQDKEKARFTHSYTSIIENHVIIGERTRMEEFRVNLEAVGPLEWREGYCDFNPL